MRKLITYQGWSDLTAKSWHKKPNLLFTITDSRASVEAERSFQFCFGFFLKMLWYCSCFSKFSPNHKILYLSAQVNSQTLSSWKLCEFLELGWELVFFQARFFFPQQLLLSLWLQFWILFPQCFTMKIFKHAETLEPLYI